MGRSKIDRCSIGSRRKILNIYIGIGQHGVVVIVVVNELKSRHLGYYQVMVLRFSDELAR